MTTGDFKGLINKHGDDAFFGFQMNNGTKVILGTSDGVDNNKKLKYKISGNIIAIYQLYQSQMGPQVPSIINHDINSISSVFINYAKSKSKDFDYDDAF